MSPPSPKSLWTLFQRRSPGFSLVELIAVIAVAGILTILAFGAMRRVSAHTSSIRCLANLKAMHTAAMAYAAEHQGEVPVDRTNKSTGSSWYMALKERYLPHPGFGRRLPPYFCPANQRQDVTGGNDGWTNYAVNANIYDGGTNMGGVPNAGDSTGVDAHLAGRRGPRFSMMSIDKVLFLDARNATGGTWYTISGTRWSNRTWPESYAVHGDHLNVIFIGGHARTVKVAPRITSPNGDLNELRAEWFWPMQ